ncbi:TetR/AcrR family transcriptional regulator [Phenylobacterium sp.]|uniref:TetR/AcrR family transcriptional regulator n=1 Tax=Phenylobacterium sp. TaxID=1871053 RepID=UPI0035B2DE98
MRYDAQHKERTRERVLKEAARAIRQDGPHRVSVADVMGKAGLTHGGFYAHFKSRDELIAEGIRQMFRESAERVGQSMEGRGPREALVDYIGFYLSPAHRDTRTAGCPLPFLSADAPRLPDPARAVFASGVAALEDRLAGLLSATGREHAADDAASLVAELVGALALARAEPDDERAYAMLRDARARILGRLGLEAAR